MSQINPRHVMVAIPCHDGRIMAELAGMLVMSAAKFNAVTLPTECSHPSLVRNIIADTFLRSPFEWLVHIDSDIVPSPEDFDLLLQTIDPDKEYWNQDNPLDEGAPSIMTDQARPPTPTRIDTTSDAGTRTMADVLVCAEYSFKNEELEPVRFGGGFVRVHRSVFETLAQMKHPPAETVEISRAEFEVLNRQWAEHKNLNDYDYCRSEVEALLASVKYTDGMPRLWQTTHKGRVFHDFYPSGPVINQFVPTSQWMGEDHGFFTLCMLAGIVCRVEQRTRLVHIGRKAYPYHGADMNGGGQ